MHRKMVSIVLGTFNRKAYLKKTIHTVREEVRSSGLTAEIIVVDGGSTDGTSEWLVKQKDILTIVQHNRGVWQGKPIERRSWGYFMNLAFKSAEGKYVCMISDDCLLVPGSLKNGIERFESRLQQGVNLGALAFYWRNWPVDQQYFVGRTVGRKMFVNHGLYLQSALSAVNYVDENSFHFYHADGDLVLRMNQAGYLCEDAPGSFVEHYADANTKVRTSNLVKQQQDWDFYLKRWDHLQREVQGFEGGWEYLEYKDHQNTANLFRFLYWRDKAVQLLTKTLLRLLSVCKN